MEGYSVTEAASVLGVPTERVWELLARGVLSGKPEGDTGMRVYLQPRPAPAPPEAARPNGNGGTEPQRELSPFRELLTEFRSLTERYGQALLALGEARGEVAALRSRVDLLEARMDLRLPTSAAPSAAGWASTPVPFPTERTVMPTAPAPAEEALSTAEPEPGPDEVHDPEEEERRARRRGPRRATESFAEALARAEDPSVPELPRGAQAGAFAALRDETEAATASTDAALPREMPAAEAVPVADETETAYAEVAAAPEPVEPEPEPAGLAQAPEVEAPAGPEPVVAGPEPVVAGPEPVVAEPEPVVAGPEPVVAEPEPVVAEPEPVVAEPEPVDAEQPEAAPPLEWDAERYTTAIEEPDWFAAEIAEPNEVADEPPAEKPPTAGPPTAEPPASVEAAWPEAELEGAAASVDARPAEPEVPEMPEIEGEEPVDAEPATSSGTGDEPEDDAGAAEMEVATTGRRPSAGAPDAGPAMPGAFELDEALAALDALAGRTKPNPAGPAPDAGPSELVGDEPEEWPPPLRTHGEPRAPQTFRPSSPATSPASRAYRRLRRIFPT